MTFDTWTLLYGTIIGLGMLGILLLEMRDQRRQRNQLRNKLRSKELYRNAKK